MQRLLGEHNIKTVEDLDRGSKTLEQIYNNDGGLIMLKGRIYSIERLKTECATGEITEHKLVLYDLTEHVRQLLKDD